MANKLSPLASGKPRLRGNYGQQVRRASYARAVEWIALNDDADEFDVDVVAKSLTVHLVAALWHTSSALVAQRVALFRRVPRCPCGSGKLPRRENHDASALSQIGTCDECDGEEPIESDDE